MLVNVSLQELNRFTAVLAEHLYPGVIILLFGEMGAGKTTFVSSLASHFHADSVCSPTFSLANRYNGDCDINHLDLYRLSTKESLFSIDIDRYLNDKAAITCIEWPERLNELMPDAYIRVTLCYLDEDVRSIEVESFDKNIVLEQLDTFH